MVDVEKILFSVDGRDRVVTTLCDRLTSLKSSELHELPQTTGSGVYCLYYFGDHGLYNGFTIDVPIYVGKATHLYNRLKDHRQSVEDASDLYVGDFKYKLLEIVSEWIDGCEKLLIEHFCPLWNKVVKGFGCHAAGKGRGNQMRSLWDTLHDGRSWALDLDPQFPKSYVHDLVLDWCRQEGFVPYNTRTFCVGDYFWDNEKYGTA